LPVAKTAASDPPCHDCFSRISDHADLEILRSSCQQQPFLLYDALRGFDAASIARPPGGTHCQNRAHSGSLTCWRWALPPRSWLYSHRCIMLNSLLAAADSSPH
jgi:hypothetical protein